MPDPICVYSNCSGPIPPHHTTEGTNYSRTHFAYVAYRDAEADSSCYGYGHTEADAIADFCRLEAEEACFNCTAACQTDEDCILFSGRISTIIHREQEAYFARHSRTHTQWRILNSPL